LDVTGHRAVAAVLSVPTRDLDAVRFTGAVTRGAILLADVLGNVGLRAGRVRLNPLTATAAFPQIEPLETIIGVGSDQTKTTPVTRREAVDNHRVHLGGLYTLHKHQRVFVAMIFSQHYAETAEGVKYIIPFTKSRDYYKLHMPELDLLTHWLGK
jgi:hypothetical protein